MIDQRSQFELIVKRATSVAAQTIVELDFAKRTQLDAIFSEVDTKVMAVFFPEDVVVAEEPKKKRRTKKVKPAVEDVL